MSLSKIFIVSDINDSTIPPGSKAFATIKEAEEFVIQNKKSLEDISFSITEVDFRSEDVLISSLCENASQFAQKSGFIGQTLPEFIALVHSEASEALEDHRIGRKPQDHHYSEELNSVGFAVRIALGISNNEPIPKGVNIRTPCERKSGAKPEGIPSEIADIIIRCCHYCGENGIDLIRAIQEKMEFNKSRPFKHGKEY